MEICSMPATTRNQTFHGITTWIVAMLMAMAAPQASASILQYEFVGVAGAGSSISFDGGSPVNVSGAAFTVTGHTVSDIDLSPSGDTIGEFAATSFYDFGSFGVFATNAGGDFYFQDCGTIASVACAGLLDPAALGFIMSFAPSVSGDPDAGGIPLGTIDATTTPTRTSSGFSTRTQINSSGDSLTIDDNDPDFFPATISSLTVTATAAPEPASLALFGLGILLLGSLRRRSISS